jgi:GTP1/Obg family GTP-binding protein
VATLVTSCGQISRISECKRFVALANQATAELRSLDAPNQIVPEAPAYDKLAKRFTRFAGDIALLKVQDRQLSEAVSNVRATMNAAARDCKEYARELREHAHASGKNQAAVQLSVRRRLARTRTRVSQSLRSYKGQVAAVNRVCQPQ